MTAKEYLKRYRFINASVKSKLLQKDELRYYAQRLSPSARFDKSGNVTDKVGRTVAKIVDLERAIQSDIDELVAAGENIRRAINRIDDERMRLILTMRYINGDSWEKIAETLHTDLRWIYRLHGRALEKIELTIESHC